VRSADSGRRRCGQTPRCREGAPVLQEALRRGVGLMFCRCVNTVQTRTRLARWTAHSLRWRATMTDEVAKLRVQYSNTPLTEEEARAAGSPMHLFQKWFDEAIRVKSYEPNAMTLATATPDGVPAARMVLLKGLDLERATFTWYTNYESRKAQELDRNPRAALVFWWPELERSVRVEGSVERLSTADSDAYFASRPLGSRLGAWASAQSRPITSREALERQAAQVEERFANGEVPRPPHWGGYRLHALRLEFWKGRANRLHDRLLFERDSKSSDHDMQWRMTRLQP
jgi:pyridoxamine 5'-phosphate oxidase